MGTTTDETARGKACEVCAKPRGTGGCTNARCASCHRAHCTPGGNTSPGHGRRWPIIPAPTTEGA